MVEQPEGPTVAAIATMVESAGLDFSFDFIVRENRFSSLAPDLLAVILASGFEKFEERLHRIVEFFQLPQIVVKMAHRIWTILIENMHLQPLAFAIKTWGFKNLSIRNFHFYLQN